MAEAKTKIRGIRLTLAEDAQLAERAKAAGVSVVDFVRAALARYSPVEGEGEARDGIAAAPVFSGAAPSRPEPEHEHDWKNHGWGTICEICKVLRP